MCVRILIEYSKGLELNSMDYEKIILELLSRIQVLEEKVDALSKKGAEKPTLTTADICRYIQAQKVQAKNAGKNKLVLISRDIHKSLNLKSRFPMVCNAMRQCMGEKDDILFQPPKGNSSTLEIEYNL